MTHVSRALASAFSVALLLPACAAAQHIRDIPEDLMHQVMPGVDRFTERGDDPTVMEAFRVDPDTGEQGLVGYVFHTADVPPEKIGYSGPIEAVVGLGLDGYLTGMRITDYRESMRSSRGDFLRPRGFQEQFTDKHIGDAFAVFEDVRSISRASVSVRAVSRGVRNAARRVADAYMRRAADATAVVADVNALSWLELRQVGIVRVMLVESELGPAEISLVHLFDDVFGERLVGPDALASGRRAVASVGEGHLFAYGVDGPRLRYFRRDGWSVAQDGDTISVSRDEVLPFGLASGGMMDAQVALTGAMVLDASIDVTRPFTILFDLRPSMDLFSAEYLTLEARRALVADAQGAPAPPANPPAGDGRTATGTVGEPPSGPMAPATAVAGSNGPPGGADGGDTLGEEASSGLPSSGTTTDSRSPGESTDAPASALSPDARASGTSTDATASGRSPDPRASGASNDVPASGPSGSPASAGPEGAPSLNALGDAAEASAPAEALDPFDLVYADDETVLGAALSRTAAVRLGAVAVVLLLATLAFFMKKRSVRAISLAVTLVFLGFVDGGFLSVSHLTSGIWRGPSVYFDDLALLLMVTFTVATTLLWGRVFCGFLCPFGALQDLLENVVPARFRVKVPQRVHDRALWVKYGVLAVILMPALAGSHASLYQYAEPFGTVFFLSTSVLLWGIALTFLVASAIVPRFYCRYACPLGAALALGSLLSLNRIRRVEQCGHCKVCEQRCPTGAIRGDQVDFKECVRCNVCETKLIEKAGACGHDMEAIRPRLVQLRVSRAAGAPRG